MELESLKRKELQALCKKQGFPANSTNSQMIENLSSILENHDKVKPKGCFKGSGGRNAEDLGIVGVLKKKVTFLVEDEEADESEEITRSPVGNSKRKSVVNKVVGIEGGSMRSRRLAEAVLWSPVIERKKIFLRVGTEGARQNDKLISSELLNSRSLRNRSVVVGGDEELVTDQNSRRSQKRNSIAQKKVTFVIEDEGEEELVEIARNPVGNSKSKSVVSNVVEIGRRNTRSRGLAEAVLWSPVIEKKKKSLRIGTEGVRKNDKQISSEVLTTRSLRNRVVVVGGDEELTTDQNSRRSQKRKISDKTEENEMVASKLEEDEFVGTKNLRKRSRGRDFVGDEAPNRKSDRNHTKLEENVAVEEVDVGRSKKRRKRDADTLIIEKRVDDDIERANRTKDVILNSNSMVSRDVYNVEGQKKAQSQGKTQASKHGDPTTSTLGSEVVIFPARRSTHSSSLVGKSDEEVEAVKKGKLQKHVKDGQGSKFVSEPVRRSTRSSLTLREDGSSLPVAGLPVNGAEEVSTGKSEKEAKCHGLKGGGEIISERTRRSAHSFSVVGKSDEEGGAIQKGRSQKGGLLDNEVVAKPTRRSTRTSSTLQEDGASLLVGKPVTVGEVVKKSKSQKQAKGHESKGGRSTTSLRDSETIAEPVRRSTRCSSSLLENGTSLPVIDAVNEVKSHKQGKGRTLKSRAAPLSDDESTPMRRLTRSSSKLLEDEALLSEVGKSSGDEEAMKNKKPAKQHWVRASKPGDSTAFLPGNEAVAEPEMRSTRGSPKLLDGRTFLPIVKGNTGKGTGDHASKKEDYAIAISTRRSTRNSSILLEDGSSPNIETFGSGNEVRKNISDKKSKNHDLAASMPDNESVITPSRISAQSSSKLLEDGNFLEAVSKDKLGKKLTNTASKEGDSTALVSASPVVSESVKEGDSIALVSDSPVVSESVRRSTCSSLKHISLKVETSLPMCAKLGDEVQDKVEASKSNGAISVSGPPVAGCSFDLSIEVERGNAETEFNDADDKNVPKMRQSLAKVEKGTSLVGSAKDLDDMCLGSQINGNQSSVFELASKGSVALPVNIEGSSEIEDNVSRQLRCSILFPIEPSSTIEVNSELTSVSARAPLKISEELSATFDTEISAMARPQKPDSMVKVGIEREDIITGSEAMHVSSSQFPKSSEELSLTTDSHTSLGIDLEERRLKVEICGSSEDGLEYDEETDIVVPTLVRIRSEELTLTAVNEADPEIDLKEPDSKVEDDGPNEDVVADDDAINIFDPVSSDTEVCTDSRTSCGIDLEEPRLKAEICGANEDGLEDVEETDIVVETLVCKSSELTLTSVTVANHEIDLKEPDSKVEVDGASEDIRGDKAKKIFDPMTSDTEVCAEPLCDINVEGSDSKVEVHDASKGEMEKHGATPTVSSVMACKSTGILLPTTLNEASSYFDLGQVDTPAMNEEASHSEGFLIEASDIRCKTLEVSMTGDRNPGDTSSTRRIFYNEMENCKVNPDIILKSHLEHGECDIMKKIEVVACEKDPQLYEDLEISKETWVTSMVSFTVNDGIENEDDGKDAEKNENELRSSSLTESYAVDRTKSSFEELVDAQQSDFIRGLYDKKPADAEEKLRGSFDDKFCAENNDSFMFPVAFMKSEGLSCAASLEHKDESSPFEISEVSTQITEGKSSVDHKSSTRLLDASSKLEKQIEKSYKLCSADVESKGYYSASNNENISLTVKKVVQQGDLPTLPVTFTYGEEILPISSTEAPTLSGNEDNEDARNLSDCLDVTVNVTENLGVDFVDRSSKSAPKEYEDVERLNVNFDVLPETSNIVNKLSDIEFERTIELGAVASEENDNIGCLRSEANVEGYVGTVLTEANSTEPDKFDHLDEVGQEQVQTFLLHEIIGISGELHTDENASHTSLNNSASMSAGERVLLLENFFRSTYMENSLSLPKMDVVFPSEEQVDEDGSEKVSAQNDTPNSEEFLSTINFIPLANQQEYQESGFRRKSFSGQKHSVEKHEKDNNLKAVDITEPSEPKSEDADNANNDSDVELEEYSNYTAKIASVMRAEAEHVVDNNINMSISGMDQYLGAIGDEKNKYQGTFESFEQASSVEEVRMEHNESLTENLFHMNNKAAAFVNDIAEVGECEDREESLCHGRCEEFSEIDTAKLLAIGEDEMKGIVSGSSVAVIGEACPYECEMSSKAQNLSGASAKTFAGVDSQATYSNQQSDDLSERRISLQQTPGVPIFLEDGKFAVLEESKFDKAVTPIPIVDCSSFEIDVNKEQNKQNTLDQIEDSI